MESNQNNQATPVTVFNYTGTQVHGSRPHPHPDFMPPEVQEEEAAIEVNIPHEIEIPKDMQAFALPTVGFYGTIDDQIDLRLIKKTALAHPEIIFVFVGTIVIDKEKLPRLHNIHYLGGKSDKEAAAYINAFTVAMLPYRVAPNTMNLLPKVLYQYMCAHKPVISTALPVVIRDYKHCVKITSDCKDFSLAIKESVFHTEKVKREMVYHYNSILNEQKRGDYGC